MSRSTLFAATAVLLLVACESPVALPDGTGGAPAFVRSPDSPAHIVSLAGKLDLSAYDLTDETYAMNARVSGDGDVDGHITVKLSDPVVSFKADITCLQVSGNLAWVGAVVTESDATSGSYAAGGSFWFRLQDNGEGSSALPDRISFLNPNGGAARCNEKRTGLSLAFEIQGNVQIR